MKSRLFVRPTLVALCLLAVAVLGCSRPRHPDVQVGLEIPEFTLTSLDGNEISSHSYRGTPVVLNFWATWCGPCRQEIPTLQAIDRGAAAKVVAIAVDDEGEELVRPFAAQHGIDYEVLLGDMKLLERFNGYAIPYTLVLDSSLKIVRMHRGLISLRMLERDLRTSP